MVHFAVAALVACTGQGGRRKFLISKTGGLRPPLQKPKLTDYPRARGRSVRSALNTHSPTILLGVVDQSTVQLKRLKLNSRCGRSQPVKGELRVPVTDGAGPPQADIFLFQNDMARVLGDDQR